MFTLEEAGLLARMLGVIRWALLCVLVGGIGWGLVYCSRAGPPRVLLRLHALGRSCTSEIPATEVR
jgi:hypothetical protein